MHADGKLQEDQGAGLAGPTCLAQRTQFPARTLQLFNYRLNNHSRSRELITFLYDVADQTNF
jgi:type II secretory pathway component PulJ